MKTQDSYDKIYLIMKYIDYFFQKWRFKMVSSYIKKYDKILDIGCNQGEFFEYYKDIQGIGLDPNLNAKITKDRYCLLPGTLSENRDIDTNFDNVVILAVFEHLSEKQRTSLAKDIYTIMKPGGLVLLTVPHPCVDIILWVLLKLKLIDGMSLDEHCGFSPKNVTTYFEGPLFKKVSHHTFQLGLNNLFVYSKI